MSRFVTRLDAELLSESANSGRGLWRLKKPLVYRSDVAGRTFVVPKGFRTDLASVPRLPFAFLLVGGVAHEASCVHDRLYSTHEVPRPVADAVLREAAIICDVHRWQAWLLWIGVRLFGWTHW